MRTKTHILIASVAALMCGSVLLAGWYYYTSKLSLDCSDDFDLIVAGAEIIDGSGRAPFIGDIGVKNHRIICIGKLDRRRGHQVLDAKGLTVAPGFIDVHTHIERNVPTDAPFLASNFLRQGVTTVITGNCGRSSLEIGKFLKLLEENGAQVNVASLIGHNTIRSRVMKQSGEKPTPHQLAEMKNLAHRAMFEGAFGMSTGLVYIPGTFAHTDEIAELAKSVAKGVYVTHIRDEGTNGVEAIREAISIGERSGVHVHISHFKVQGPKQWGSAQARLDLIKAAEREGLIVSLDQYPYTASSTGLAVLMPSWLSQRDLGTARNKLSDPATRKRVRNEMIRELRANGWKDYSFARVAYYHFDRSLVGMSIAEITHRRGAFNSAVNHKIVTRSAFYTASSSSQSDIDKDVERQADTVIDLFTHGGAQMVFFDMNDVDVETIMKSPQVMFGSDSSVRQESPFVLPHPRGLGTFPRILARYAREKHLFSIEEAIRKMTSLPAHTFGLKERGQIREGYWADLVVFGRNQILDTATYERPLSNPEGIHFVIVNGSVVLNQGMVTTSLPGMAIRHDALANY